MKRLTTPDVLMFLVAASVIGMTFYLFYNLL